jgi:hypothetical protein
MNEEQFPESSLDLTLMQHPYDEDCKLQKVHTRFEVAPSSLVLSHFSKLSHLGDFVASQPHLW